MDTPDRTLVTVGAALSAGAGLVHLGVTPDHVAHHWSMGASFLAVGWAQLAWAVAVMVRYDRRLVTAGLLLQVACVAGLVVASTAGWPFGPLAGRPEEVGTAALLAVGLELAAAAAATALLLGGLRLPAAVLPVALAVVVTSSSVALAVDAGHDADDPTHQTSAAGAVGAPHAHGGEAPDAQVASAAGAAPTAQGAGDAHGAAGQASADAAASGHASEGTGHAHGPVDTTPPTPAQQAAADDLLAASKRSMQRYAMASVAEADGYRVVHDAGGKLLHYAHPGYSADGRTLDPTRIESLLYVVLPGGGGTLLVGGMFIMPKGEAGPEVGGSLTQWHAHDDLCLDPVKGMAITQLPGGGCPSGSTVGTTGEMMHVWAIDYPGGPFGELEAGAVREAVLDVYGMGTVPAAT